NDATPFREESRHSSMQPDVQDMRHEVAATEALCISHELVERQADGRVVRSDNCAGARSDDDVDRDVVLDELLEHAKVARAAQPAATEHHADSNWRVFLHL